MQFKPGFSAVYELLLGLGAERAVLDPIGPENNWQVTKLLCFLQSQDWLFFFPAVFVHVLITISAVLVAEL